MISGRIKIIGGGKAAIYKTMRTCEVKEVIAKADVFPSNH
jgi:hypothetical protein